MVLALNKLGDIGQSLPDETLTGSLKEFREMPGADLIERTTPFFAWQNKRREFDMWPYARSTATAGTTGTTADAKTGADMAKTGEDMKKAGGDMSKAGDTKAGADMKKTGEDMKKTGEDMKKAATTTGK